MKIIAIEGRCLIKASQVQTNLRSLIQSKRRLEANDEVQPLHKENKGVSLDFFKEKFCFILDLVETQIINTTFFGLLSLSFKGKRKRQHQVGGRGFKSSLCQTLSHHTDLWVPSELRGLCHWLSMCPPLWLYFTVELTSVEDRLKEIFKATDTIILIKKKNHAEVMAPL